MIDITENNVRLALILIFIIIMAIIYCLCTNRGSQLIDLSKVIVEALPTCPNNSSYASSSNGDGSIKSLEDLKKAVDEGKCVRIISVRD